MLRIEAALVVRRMIETHLGLRVGEVKGYYERCFGFEFWGVGSVSFFFLGASL